jgi:hypothetical protein
VSGLDESGVICIIVGRYGFLVVAGVPQQVCHMFAEIRMEQDLSCLAKSIETFGDHNGSDEEGRAQHMEVLTDEPAVCSIRSAVYCGQIEYHG